MADVSLNHLLLLAIVSVIIPLVWLLRYWLKHDKFLQLLSSLLLEKKHSLDPILLSTIPRRFKPLIAVLQELQQSIPFSTERDKLTGLANRLGLKRKMLAKMPLTQGVLVLIDIHQFRYVNDLFSFKFGDKLLQAFAERLQAHQPFPEFLTRMNGNEFLLFYPNDVSIEALEEIKVTLQQPFSVDEHQVSVKIHMGVLQLSQHHADVSLMLRRLDLALKNAKKQKRPIAFYQENDDKVQYRALLIINTLAKSLKQNELFMMYQPKLDIETQQCLEVEALIRWQHSELGFISPNEFIPLAENSGMINLVSQWVMDTVIAQIAVWHSHGLDVQVAINLSTSDLDNPHFVQDISAKLAQHNVPASSLLIEITESALMVSLDATIEILNRLRELGLRIAIDDFGTGHSSLAYLRYLPVDEVKIDKAFLDDVETDCNAKQIVKTSIELAKGLGFDVTVEGVETKAVLELVKNFGANTIQGDYFSKPLMPKELEANFSNLIDKLKLH